MGVLAKEAIRQQALESYALLSGAPEPELDALVGLVAQLLGAPVAMLSLIDHDRLVFKARVGLEQQEAPRHGSFCSAAAQSDELFVVPDAAADPRFVHHPMVVGEEHLRFYAAVPLVTPRRAVIGTLCVIDRKPRELLPAQVHTLRVLAQLVMVVLEQRRRSLLRDAVIEALDGELRLEVEDLRRLAASGLAAAGSPRGEAGRAVRLLSGIEQLEMTVDSLAELVRVGLGAGPRLLPAPVDLRELCQDAIDELAAGAGVAFEFVAEGDCTGHWDAARLAQTAMLLFEEARARSPEHGSVLVLARGQGEEVLLEVTIPATDGEPGVRIHLARELMQALGGKIDFKRTATHSTFFVALPRLPVV